MRYRREDANGDYVFGPFSTWAVDSPEAVSLAVRSRLKLYTEEWFLDLTEGLEKTHILGYGTQPTRDQEIQQRILGTRGVKGLLAYSSQVDPTTRSFTVACAVDTIYGPVTITEVL
jgi:hypothetical protein